jgi:hypothetical protein
VYLQVCHELVQGEQSGKTVIAWNRIQLLAIGVQRLRRWHWWILKIHRGSALIDNYNGGDWSRWKRSHRGSALIDNYNGGDWSRWKRSHRGSALIDNYNGGEQPLLIHSL